MSDTAANPTMSPCWLSTIGVFQDMRPRLPISVTVSLSHSTACAAVYLPTAWSHVPETDKTGRSSRGEKGRAAPVLPQWIGRGSLGYARKPANVVLHWPCHAAVRPSESAEVDLRSVEPEGRVPTLVSREVGVACHPAPIVDAVASADRATERGEAHHVVLGLPAVLGRLDNSAVGDACQQRCDEDYEPRH